MIFDAGEICGDDQETEDQSGGWKETDLKPEYIQYKDEGCEHARSCLACPFPRCLYEGVGRRQHRLKKLRDREIYKLFQSGRKPEELTRFFKVSERTIYRAIQDNIRQKKRKRRYRGVRRDE